MTLRRWLVGTPLALLVAILAHAASFGSSHGLARGYGGLLVAFLVAGLVAVASATLLAIACGGAGRSSTPSECARRLRRALPGAGSLASMAAFLGAGGLVMFAAIETLEGRGVPAWILGPVALCSVLVAALGHLATEGLARLGLALRNDHPVQTSPARESGRVYSASHVRSHDPAGVRRGRAPPLRA
jgi:hypothetical protein